MPPGSECSSAMLLLRNNRRPQGHHARPLASLRPQGWRSDTALLGCRSLSIQAQGVQCRLMAQGGPHNMSAYVRYQVKSGHEMLVASLSAFEPKRTSGRPEALTGLDALRWRACQ